MLCTLPSAPATSFISPLSSLVVVVVVVSLKMAGLGLVGSASSLYRREREDLTSELAKDLRFDSLNDGGGVT